MKKIALSSVLLSAFLLSCSNDGIMGNETKINERSSENAQSTESIPFNVLENYFRYKELDDNQFNDEETFLGYFGQAGYMGNPPTVIDWWNEFIIVVDEPETNYETTIIPISLTKRSDGQLEFTYKVVKGELRTCSTRPFIAISVDFEHYSFEDVNLIKLEEDQTNISFNVLENYFRHKGLNVNKFDDEEAFLEYFGEAGYMGNSPTVVDWWNEIVIAVDEPETNYETTINPISLTRNSEGQLKFTYKVGVGKLRTYSTRPFSAISVDFEHYSFEDIVLDKHYSFEDIILDKQD